MNFCYRQARYINETLFYFWYLFSDTQFNYLNRFKNWAADWNISTNNWTNSLICVSFSSPLIVPFIHIMNADHRNSIFPVSGN